MGIHVTTSCMVEYASTGIKCSSAVTSAVCLFTSTGSLRCSDGAALYDIEKQILSETSLAMPDHAARCTGNALVRFI